MIVSLILLSISQQNALTRFVAPGVEYLEKRFQGPDQLVRMLKIDPKAKLRMEPAYSRLGMINTVGYRSQILITQIMKEHGANAAINGDFYGGSAVTIGACVAGGRLLRSPHPHRPVFAWGTESFQVARLGWKAQLEINGKKVPVDALNEICGPDRLIMTTHDVGQAIAEQPSRIVVCRIEEGELLPQSKLQLEVTRIASESTVDVGEAEIVLTGRGRGAAALSVLKPGTRINLNVNLSGVDWSKHPNAITGGPTLVRNGKTAVDLAESRFKPDFGHDRTARSAIGWTKDGRFAMMVIEGRQARSQGVTVKTWAQLLVALGIEDAINLDGGGGTSLALNGQVLNKTTDGAERPIANAVLLWFDSPQPNGTLAVQPRIKVGEEGQAKLFRESGQTAPALEVIFTGKGPIDISADGSLTGLAAGEATVEAHWLGSVFKSRSG